jgi:hypothetical protein
MPRRGYRKPATGGTRKRKPSSAGHGGARAGAGRPKGIPWDKIKRAARAGAPYDDIVAAYVGAVQLADKANQEKLREIIDEGHAHNRVNLRLAIAKRGLEDGSVNLLLGKARNELDPQWDSQNVAQAGVPDTLGAAERLGEILDKLGRKVKRKGRR